MSDSKKMQDTENTNEWIDWIEEAVAKEHLNYYEYSQFTNVQEIGAGGFGKVYRANWRNSKKRFALKSFFNLNNITMKEVVCELKIQRKVDFHDNIIRCYGITKFESENRIRNNYMLVMEYADSGSLRSYLEKNFSKLTWNDKFNMAYQLAYAVPCLHDEGIIHRDLHSGNILVHQNTINFSRRKNNNNQMYSLNEKSDVYSVGVLLWELSSGRPPFYTEGEHYDLGLMFDISQGHRETVVPDTPDEYMKIYTKCWDGEPDNRPTIYQVVDLLKAIITKPDSMTELPNDQKLNEILNSNPLSTNNLETRGELSQLIQNFDKMNAQEIDAIAGLSTEETSSTDKNFDLLKAIITKSDSMTELPNDQKLNEILNSNPLSTNNLETRGELSQLIQNFDKMNTQEIDAIAGLSAEETSSTEKNFSIIVDEINELIFKSLNKGIEKRLLEDQVKYYFNSHNIKLQEIHNWLLINQNTSNSMFLLGYINLKEIKTNGDLKKTFNLFLNASEKNHILAQYYVGNCYKYGNGTIKNERLAFEYYKKVANKNFTHGQLGIGHCYEIGIGIKKDFNMAFYWYNKAANNGNIIAMYHLGNCYKNGEGVEIDYNKALELFKRSSEGGCPEGITLLECCYNYGIETEIDLQKSFELYQKSANLGEKVAQYNLGFMYENGDGITNDMKDINKAIYWYRKSANQKYRNAQNRLKLLQINK
ncbi:kinase-like domain-containing protein [Rhizophagus clarus]|uniref:Kinase-like domain-containing protein n=1 Tax=Rhizophagus clarus TaxID=94130 RepID=A0A8H3R5W9_9GLOM|nr:kinase-like domain-containing protein [Rhizophagus clarus]